MRIIFLIISLACFNVCSFSQEKSSDSFPADSSLSHASVSMCIADAEKGDIIMEYNSEISLMPASVMLLLLQQRSNYLVQITHSGPELFIRGRLTNEQEN